MRLSECPWCTAWLYIGEKCGVCGKTATPPKAPTPDAGEVHHADGELVLSSDGEAMTHPGDDIPLSECPRCTALLEDHDGFGVMRHEACGYCAHPAYSDDKCDICGKTATPPKAPTTDTAQELCERFGEQHRPDGSNVLFAGWPCRSCIAIRDALKAAEERGAQRERERAAITDAANIMELEASFDD